MPLLILSATAAAIPVVPHASGLTEAPAFQVLDVFWGTQSAKVGVGPGSLDVPLTVVAEYTYSESTMTIEANLTLPSGFTDNTGNAVATSYISAGAQTGTTVQFTFYLNIGSNVSLGVQSIPTQLSWLAQSATGPTTLVQFTSISVPVEGIPELAVTPIASSLVAGELNNVSFAVKDTGNGKAGQVSLAVSASSGATVISQPSPVATLAPGKEAIRFVGVFVPDSAAGSAVTLTFVSTYVDPYNYTDTATDSLGLLVPSNTQQSSDVVLTFQSAARALAPDSESSITITVTNAGTTLARQIATDVSSVAATVLAQPPVIPSLAPGANATETVTIFVPASSAGSAVSLSLSSSYLDINNNTDSSTQTLGFSVAAASLPDLEATSTAASTALIPGQANTIPVTVSNTGTGAATDILTSASVSAQDGSVESVSPTDIATLEPGSSTVVEVTLFVANASANSPITLDLAFDYSDSYGTPQTGSGSIELEVGAAAPAFAGVSLSVESLENSVVAGETSTVSFVIENTGTVALYSPAYTLSVSQPLIIAANSSSTIGTVIEPGQNRTVYAGMTASPGATSGIYSATVSIQFTNQEGVSDTESFSVSVLLSGPIDLVIQSEQVSQTATGITVTGNVLNEGQSPAYYASVSGYVNGTSANESDYVGEIDVNSPTPFSVTIPYQAQSNPGVGNITVTIQYKNSLGQAANSSSEESARLQSLSQILAASSTGTAPSSQGGPNLLEITLIGTIVLVVVGTAVFALIRRRAAHAPTPQGSATEGSARVEAVR